VKKTGRDRPLLVWLLVASQAVYFAVIFMVLSRAAAPDWQVVIVCIGLLHLMAAAVGLSTWRFRFSPGSVALGLVLATSSIFLTAKLIRFARHVGFDAVSDFEPFFLPFGAFVIPSLILFGATIWVIRHDNA